MLGRGTSEVPLIKQKGTADRFQRFDIKHQGKVFPGLLEGKGGFKNIIVLLRCVGHGGQER